MFERAVAWRQLRLAAVLCDNDGLGREDRPPTNAAKKIQRLGVLVLCFIRRVEKDEVDRLRQLAEPLQHGSDAAIFDRKVTSNPEGREILPKRCQRSLRVFRKPDVRSAAAQRFYPNGSGTGIKIDETASLQLWRKDIEEGFAQPVAGGTGLHAAGGDQLTGAEGSGDDAHLLDGKPDSELHDGNAYNSRMRGWSFPIGRFLGVDVRVHTFFLLLLGLSISYASMTGATGGRGLVLWLLLVLAIAVREVARAIAAAWYGLELRSILLLPTGGLLSYATPEATELASTPALQKRMGVIGPIANIGFGLLLAAIALTFSPEVNIYERPWLSPSYLLRAAVWMNLLLGAVNLLPASPLDGGRVFRGEFAKTRGAVKGSRAAAGLGQMIALGLMIAGFVIPSVWLIMIGGFVLIGAHMEDQSMLLQTDVDAVRMRDVMLTQFSMLSASDTLEDALQRSVHTLQDVFPVVRGANLVGAVSRQSIVEALHADGNGYVQGVMTRSFQTAQPDDSLVKTLRRIMAGHGAQMVPVLEGNRIVGIITPQNLAHSMGLLNQRRKMRPQE
jgi:Zn-dependent protease/predicted transcriptional regulator